MHFVPARKRVNRVHLRVASRPTINYRLRSGRPRPDVRYPAWWCRKSVDFHVGNLQAVHSHGAVAAAAEVGGSLRVSASPVTTPAVTKSAANRRPVQNRPNSDCQ